MSGAVQTWKCGSLLYTKRGLFALFGWLLWGDVCFTLMEAVVPSILPLHFKNLGASNVTIGFVLTSLPGVFNLTVTPWLSFKSDRHRSRWGRRIPFMLFTAPFLALSLIMIGFSDSIGAWVHRAFFSGSTIGQVQVVIVLLTCFAAMFDLFNMFVNTVFWYLFRDVVPEGNLSQFNAYFKVVGTTTATLYNFFIFKYAESHMREIYIGAALLYVIGFGAMLLNVKEGEYPPVTDVTEKTTFLQKIRLYAKECFTLRYYWDIFLWQMFQAVSFACGVYQVFFFKSLGLSLDLIGKKGALAAVTGPVCLLILARYVDRWKPMRVAAYGIAWGAFHVLGAWVWLVIPNIDPMVYFWIFVGGGVFSALLGAAGAAAGAPLLMILFPKDKYGQFSGAMALIRAVALMSSGVLAGLFLDFWKHMFPEGDYYYRFNFLWQGPLTLLSFYFFYRIYRVWKRMEKEGEFTPPEEKFRLSDLPPSPDQPSGLLKPVVWFIIIAFVGSVLGSLVWIGYYSHFVPKPEYVKIFSLALGINTALFFAYLRFMKFMERP